MRIAFAHTGENPLLDYFIKSVQGYELWQITDYETPAIDGCQVFRYEKSGEGFMYWRAKAYAAFNKPALYMDTDIIVNRSLEPLEALDYDVMLTKQTVIVRDPAGVNITELMPYNGGVVFVKHPEFWPHVVRLMDEMQDGEKKWYGDQLAIAQLAKYYRTIELPVKIYNYTPKPNDTPETVADKWIIHFKGDRKNMMGTFAK